MAKTADNSLMNHCNNLINSMMQINEVDFKKVRLRQGYIPQITLSLCR